MKYLLLFVGFIGGVWLYSSVFGVSGTNSTGVSGIGRTSGCHSSYSGCLKANASDYDCVGGSGNGPYYTGRVRVTGPDVFGLDRDGDGWGCE